MNLPAARLDAGRPADQHGAGPSGANLILVNIRPKATPTALCARLVAAYQMIMPGEWARVHRHIRRTRFASSSMPSPAPTRRSTASTSPLAPGDVLLTPNWSTHGHGNQSKGMRLLA